MTENEKIRLECLKVAAAYQEFGMPVLQVAEEYFNFVKEGTLFNPAKKKEAPKLIDASKRFKPQ
jgi:hypothetical protein